MPRSTFIVEQLICIFLRSICHFVSIFIPWQLVYLKRLRYFSFIANPTYYLVSSLVGKFWKFLPICISVRHSTIPTCLAIGPPSLLSFMISYHTHSGICRSFGSTLRVNVVLQITFWSVFPHGTFSTLVLCHTMMVFVKRLLKMMVVFILLFYFFPLLGSRCVAISNSNCLAVVNSSDHCIVLVFVYHASFWFPPSRLLHFSVTELSTDMWEISFFSWKIRKYGSCRWNLSTAMESFQAWWGEVIYLKTDLFVFFFNFEVFEWLWLLTLYCHRPLLSCIDLYFSFLLIS